MKTTYSRKEQKAITNKKNAVQKMRKDQRLENKGAFAKDFWKRLFSFFEKRGEKSPYFLSVTKYLGMSHAYFRIASERNVIMGVDVLANIMMLYPELSIEWLFTGKGTMLKNATMDEIRLFEKRAKKRKELEDKLTQVNILIKDMENIQKEIA